MNLTHAGLQKRIQAFAYDYMIILAYVGLLVLLAFGLNHFVPSALSNLFGTAYSGQMIGFFTITLPIVLYFILMEASGQQATWGKKRVGIRVRGIEEDPVGYSQSASRSLLKFIPWEIAHTCIWQIRFSSEAFSPLVTTGYILLWTIIIANLYSLWNTPFNQTIYDRLSSTRVVRSR